MSNLTTFLNSNFKSRQAGTIVIANGTTSNTATITAVDTTKLDLTMPGFTTSTTANDWPARIALTNSTTITATREGTNGALTVAFQIIDFY